MNKLCLVNSFKNIIENLWPSDNKYIKPKFCHENNSNKYYAPYELMNIKNKFDSPKDLVNYIIMNLHIELNKKPNNIYASASNINYMPNQSDPKAMFNFFVQNFMNENKSFISDNYYGTLLTKIDCLNCKSSKYNYEIFPYLIFPLEEVVKFKENKLMMSLNQIPFNNNITLITINDCFEYNQKIQILSGENAIPCNLCNITSPSNYCSYIYTAPEILIIILEKNKYSNTKLEFNFDLDLYNYIVERQTGYKFNLIGIVSKFGDFGNNEYYISFCKSPIDNCWYKYNNDFVSKVNNLKKEIIDSGEPNVLFYQKIK